LEFNKIAHLLAGFTQTGPGYARAEALSPLVSDEEVVAALAEVAELVTLFETTGLPPIGGLHDLRPVFASLKATGTSLDAETFLIVLSSLETMDTVRNFFSDKSGLPQTLPRVGRLKSCQKLAMSIRSSIGSRGDILDSASTELARIRRSIGSSRQGLRSQLQKMLGDHQLSGAFLRLFKPACVCR
jgi:DNA mismatch repair protein MutS2